MFWSKARRIKTLEREVELLKEECGRVYNLATDIQKDGDKYMPTINKYFKSVNLNTHKILNNGLYYPKGNIMIRKQTK